jgi:hypothetical protein
VKVALGFPMIADFMTYFPVYIYADTIKNCREYIMKRFKCSNFEDTLVHFWPPKTLISPVSILLSYAWYFERDRYAWSMQVCGHLRDWNKEIPQEHHILEEHTAVRTPWPQTAFHEPYSPKFARIAHASYCLSKEQLLASSSGAIADGKDNSRLLENDASCQGYSFQDLYPMFAHDLQLRNKEDVVPTSCNGSAEVDCIAKLKGMFEEYTREVLKEGRPALDWDRSMRVDEIATNEWNLTCKPFPKSPSTR